jgi:uncharacterized small protein (DUF1192 family)
MPAGTRENRIWRSLVEDDLEPRRAPAKMVLGGDLSALSIDELTERISACESEIARLRAAIAEKRKSQATAADFFRT